MVGLRYMKKLVNEFQVPETSVAKAHYHDLQYTSLMLFNAIVENLRYPSRKGDWFRIVLETSKVIEETTLMEEQMKGDIAFYKQDLMHWHREEHDQKMAYRIPTKVKTFKGFRDKKSCKAKDWAIEIVTKMYRLDQVNRKQILEEIEASKVPQHDSSELS